MASLVLCALHEWVTILPANVRAVGHSVLAAGWPGVCSCVQAVAVLVW